MPNDCRACQAGRDQALAMNLGYECPDHGIQEISIAAELRLRENMGRTGELMICISVMCRDHCAKGEPVALGKGPFAGTWRHEIRPGDLDLDGKPVRPEVESIYCGASPIWARPDLTDETRAIMARNLAHVAGLIVKTWPASGPIG